MRLIFLLFDSLNRQALGAYGGTIGTPNFDRLGARSVTFDRHYVGSMPCMPARRDLLTGRVGFYHRSWGPLEPFDRSLGAELRQVGVHSHLLTDHYHYARNGGATYHTTFSTWDLIRGQENDPWKALVAPPLDRFRAQYDQRHYDMDHPVLGLRKRHMINREFEQGEGDHTTARTFAAAFEFLNANRAADNWMLQLELFDPHEPFHVPDRFRRPGDSDWQGPVLNWPPYKRRDETDQETREIRASYAALVRMCDEYLGRVLDYMDDHAMWDDTAVILSTDHGFLLGEHEWWGKGRMPYYDELVHTPLMIWHPAHADRAGARVDALTQTPDLMPTILDIFGCTPPPQVTGKSLLPALAGADHDGRVVAFGYFAGPVGVTDGRHVMFHYPPDLNSSGLHEYTLMPQHMAAPFSVAEMKTARMSAPFDFTQDMPVMQIAALPAVQRPPGQFDDIGFRLYDLATDPAQTAPIQDATIEARLLTGLRSHMRRHDAPGEYYGWLGLEPGTDSRRDPGQSPD